MQIFLEQKRGVSALSAVLYGSNEAMVWDKGVATFSGMLARGAVIERLPLPPVSLMAAMLREREPALQVNQCSVSAHPIACPEHR